jgi:hypothetical protein
MPLSHAHTWPFPPDMVVYVAKGQAAVWKIELMSVTLGKKIWCSLAPNQNVYSPHEKKDRPYPKQQ